MSLLVRLASTEAPVGQMMFHRSAWALLPILGYLAWRGQFPLGLKTRRPMGHFKRSLFGALSMGSSFVSLVYLPLALATALSFLAPLLSVPVAAMILRERPGLMVTGAAILGFGGILLMLAPAFDGPSWDTGTIIGIAAGLATAGTSVISKVQVKTLTMTEPPGTIAFYFALVSMLIGLITWPFGWASLSTGALIWLVAAGLTGGCAHIAMTEAVARALFDFLIFSLIPDPLSLGGALLVVVAAAVVAFADQIVAMFRRSGAR